MKILVLSDIHIEFEDFEVDHSGSDVVVLAGDIHCGEKGLKWALEYIRDVPVIYVLGNHEYYKQAYPKLLGKLYGLSEGTNLTILENRSVTIDGVVFYGCTLWTDFELFGNPRVAGYECQQKMTDYRKIRKNPSYSKIRSLDIALINKRSVNWLRREYKTNKGAKNIIVTHHAPSAISIPDSYKNDILSAAYASNLEGLVEELSPDVWIHGHLHNSSDYRIGSTRVVCNPKGYPDERNEEFNPKFFINV